MVEKDYVAKGVVIRWSGLFDLEEVYKKSKEWFDTRVMSFKEEKYIERVKPNGKQIEIKWKITKKEGNYIKKVIEIGILIIGLNKVEVEKDGIKMNLEKGDIEFQFSAYLIKNADDKFDDEGLSKKIYEMIYRRRIEDYKIDFYDSVYGLIEEVKGLMEMYA